MLVPLDHVYYYLFTLQFPLITILQGVAQVFVARHTKHATRLEIPGQRDDVIIKKPKFPLLPVNRRVLLLSPSLIRTVAFFKEPLVPLLVYLPMLHGVRNV